MCIRRNPASSAKDAISALCALLLLLALAGAWAEQCSFTNSGWLSVRQSTNATGHPEFNVRLEQPIDAESWQLDIELGTSACDRDGAERKILIIKVNGGARTPPPPRVPPPGYVQLAGLGLYREATRVEEWAAAREVCSAEGAALAMPASSAEADAMAGVFAYNATGGATRSKLAWLGASDIAKEGVFVTLTGVPLELHGYNKWTPHQPAGKTTENCLAFWTENALLEDVPCTWKLPFVCKFSL